jgi:DNA-binding protein YbaB
MHQVMIGDMFSKLNEARKKIEESKKRLNETTVEITTGENEDIKVVATGNKSIKSIVISDAFYERASKNELEEAVLIAVNKALDEAAAKGELIMKDITKDVLPNFPGLV